MAEGIKTMEIKKIEMNGKVYEFVNETKDTRHGFAHVSTLFIDNYQDAKKLSNENFRQDVAHALYVAILRFFDEK